MKRILAVLLILVLTLTFAVTALAEDDSAAISVQKSVYAPSASMAECKHLFKEAEMFGSSAYLNKAMTAVILARYSGAPEEAPSAPICGDIDPAAWYAFGAQWAVSKGVMTPDEDGLFHPERSLNLEELCLAMNDFLSATGHSLKIINAWYSFLDAGNFSRRGRQAATLMQEAGVLIEGHDGFFYPANVLTVSQAEPVFLRFFGAMQNASFPGLPVATVAESDPVDDSWFDDACFIGHSQVVGMSMSFNLPKADFYCAIGYTAQNILDDYVEGPNNRYVTLPKALRNNADKYRKVYIMLGINDCDDSKDRIANFMRPMRQIMDLVKETQPNATIYLLSLAPVGRDIHMPVLYNPENCIVYSQAIKSLSREYGAEYLDIYRLMADDEGYMRDEFNSGDGLHFKASQYYVIKDYLKCHTGF